MAAIPCNDPHSDFEFLGRILKAPANFKKNGILKKTCLYPKNKPDDKDCRYFTNKISVVRICRGHRDKFSWTNHSDLALANTGKNSVFKGFLAGRVALIRQFGFMLEEAATSRNPYHSHIVISQYKIPFREVELLSEVLPDDVIAQLNALQEQLQYIEFSSNIPVSESHKNLCDFMTL